MKISELFESNSDKEIHAVIREWRKHYRDAGYRKEPFGNYEITAKGIDHKAKHLYIYDFMLNDNGELPIKFWRCNALEIVVHNSERLKSFKNFPEIISRQRTINPYDAAFESAYDINISSLEGIPRWMGGGSFSLGHFPKLSLHNIHKHMDFAERVHLPGSYTGPLLGFLKMPYMNHSAKQLSSHHKTRTGLAVEIINKHMNSGKNIIACQEELFKNDLDEFAQL